MFLGKEIKCEKKIFKVDDELLKERDIYRNENLTKNPLNFIRHKELYELLNNKEFYNELMEDSVNEDESYSSMKNNPKLANDAMIKKDCLKGLKCLLCYF